jgi:methylmalonyl-CoA mutase C-terminal domain/subunit
VITLALREAGMEVIYTGLRQTYEEIVVSAVEEDVDLIGLSILSGAHMVLIGKLIEHLNEKGMDDIPVVVGGVIPEKDAAELKGMGVKEIFRSGSALSEIVDFIARCAREKQEAEGG